MIKKFTFIIALTGILSFAANVVQAAPSNAKVLSLEGNAYRLDSLTDTIVKDVEVGDLLQEGAVISTGAESIVRLALANGSEISLSAETEIQFEELKQEPHTRKESYLELKGDPSISETQIFLNYGSIWSNIKELNKESKFHVLTPFGNTIVEGTIIRVTFEFDAVNDQFRHTTKSISGDIQFFSPASSQTVTYGKNREAVVRYPRSEISPATQIIPTGASIAVIMDRDHPYASLLIGPRSLGPIAVGPVDDGPNDDNPGIFTPDMSEPNSGATN
jgi:hypothetical protein